MEFVIPIIVPLYRSYHLLEKFIAALELEENIHFHCKFIDNTEEDEFKKHEKFVDELMLGKYGLSRNIYVLLRSDYNKLYSKSVNDGFKTLTYQELLSPFFLVFNPDCFPLEKNWLTKFNKCWESAPYSIATLGSIQYCLENKAAIWHAGCMWKKDESQKCHPLDWNHITQFNVDPNKEGIFEVDGNTGTGIAISTTKFYDLGFLNELKHPHYCSDSDFCLRATQKGFTHYCSTVQMFHNPGNSVKK